MCRAVAFLLLAGGATALTELTIHPVEGSPTAALKLNPQPDTKLLFGERGLGSQACEDIASSSWEQKRSESEDRWFVKTSGRTYECGDCSVGCTGEESKYQVKYNLSDVDSCPTRFLTAVPQSPFDCNAVPKRTQNGDPYQRTMNIVVFGSSHSRVLFFHIWRLLAGKRWPEPLPEELLTYEHGGGGGALGGHQISTFDFCESRLRLNIGFHFKTYFLSTANDEEFLRVLNEWNITGVDLLITEESIWSRFERELQANASRTNTYMRAIGEPTSRWGEGFTPAFVDPTSEWAEGWNVTMAFEENHYLDWLAHHFNSKRTYTIIAVGSGESPDQKGNETAEFIARVAAQSAKTTTWNACVLDKRILARPPAGMVCVHGCDGPVPMIHAQAILRSILTVLSS